MAIPKYSILIQPQCDSDGVSHLFVSLTLDPLARKTEEVLCQFQTNIQTHSFTKANLHAHDDAGPLPLNIGPSSNVSSNDWVVGRDTVGAIILQLEVGPSTAPDKPPVDLRRDQGGLIGCGSWFLPSISYYDRFLFSVEWDLSLLPVGARACWSYGEGPEKTTREGPLPLLLNSIFMVGKIHSSRAQHHSSAASTVYWFGEMPAHFEPVKQFNESMLPFAYSVFDDEISMHSIFLRKTPKGQGGHNFSSALVLEYSDGYSKFDDSTLICLATHELVHNWLYLGNEPDGYQNLWYIEGIAQFYALYLPVRAGFRGAAYFCETINTFLCAYYTNPFIGMPLRQAEADCDGDIRAQWTPYMRGVVYLLLVDASLRQLPELSHMENPIDSVVLSIMHKHYNGTPTNTSTWLEALYPLLGKEIVDKQYHALVNGGLLQLDSEHTFPVAGHLVKLQAVEQETFELGFSPKSIRSGVVEGVLAGSRAALAGIQNGDIIQHYDRVSKSLREFEEKATFTVTRPGQSQPITLEFWPRSYDKVYSIQATEVQNSTL